MRKWHDVEQNTDEWQALRCGKVTASNFGKFMANYGKAFGEPAKDYAVRIALEQITGIPSPSLFSSAHTDRGHEQEQIARALYEVENFCTVGNGGFFECGGGAYGDSPDGLVGNDRVIEIKSVIATTHYANIMRGTFDPAYKWQMIGHLDCSGRQFLDSISYCSEFPEENQLFVFTLNADDYHSELAILRERREEFLALVQKTKQNILERM